MAQFSSMLLTWAMTCELGACNFILLLCLTMKPCFSYEQVQGAGLGGILVDAPQCIFDHCDEPGTTSLHVYVGNYKITQDECDASDAAQ